MLVGRVRLAGFERRGKGTPTWDRSVRELSRLVGIKRQIRVRECAGATTPLTRGILRPVIILPTAMRTWSADRMRSVLLHELCHIKRGDSFSLAMAYWICSLLWFVPPIWPAYSRLYMEQEKECDAAVIDLGVERHSYASCILDAAQLYREPALLGGPSFLGRRKKMLKDRVQAIVTGGENMKKGAILFGFGLFLLAATVLLSAAGQGYVLKANEEIYGTWTNEGAKFPKLTQKQVNFPGGYKNYALISDTKPFEISTVQIAEKWTDTEGNVWYKIRATVTFGVTPSGVYKGYDYRGWKFQNLLKISKSGTVLELMWVHVPESDPSLYPTKIDPTDSEHYVLLYRVKE